jgi:hypothetical protein
MAGFQRLPFGLGKLRRSHFIRLAIAAIVLFVAIQFIPYGHDHSNPPVVQEPVWNNPQTRALAVTACYDCHSNQTDWRWYTNVAPISWLVQSDVSGGRNKLNFSDVNQNPVNTQRIARAIQNGSMPPLWYLPMHPSANLSPEEKQALVSGIEATFGTSGTRTP